MLNPLPIAPRASSSALRAAAAALALGSGSAALAHFTHQYSFNALTPIDSIGTAHATLVAPALLSAGVVNTSQGGYVSIPPATGAEIASAFTIEIWAAWRGSAAADTLLVTAGPAPVALAIRTSSTGGTTFDIPGSNVHIVLGQIATGRLTQIVLVYESDWPGLKCFIDGSLHAQAPLLRPISNLGQMMSAGFDLGGSSQPGERSFNGTIDEVRVYSHALNDSIVRSNWIYGPDLCARPTVLSQIGSDRTTCIGGTARWTLSTSDPAGNVYQWQRRTGASADVWENLSDGPLPGLGVVLGSASQHLTIQNAAPEASARFRCAMSNPCGDAVSDPFTFATCRGNFNCAGTADSSDLFAYLAAWFAGDDKADIDGNPGVTVQDVLDFLTAWFQGC